MRVAVEAEVAGAAEGKVVVEGEVVAEAAAEVGQAMLRQPPALGLVPSTVTVLGWHWHRAIECGVSGHSLRHHGLDRESIDKVS